MILPIRTLIVDDEPTARAGLRRLLASDADIRISGECGGGRAAVTELRHGGHDLVLLDVQMPVIGGFDVVRAVGEQHMPVVVFVTAYDRYALQAFDARAIDYVLKPFSDQRFNAAISRAKELVRLRRERPLEAPPEFVRVHARGRSWLVSQDDVVWVEAVDCYVRVHTTTGQDHLLRETLARFARRLDPRRFIRIHRSAMVARRCIRNFTVMSRGRAEVLLTTGQRLDVSRRRRRAVDELLSPS